MPTYLFIILLHQLLIYLCFYNYIPSMLKRIGLGLVLFIVINVILTVLAGNSNYSFGHMFYCVKEFDSKSFSKQQWTIFNDIIWAIVWYTTNVVLTEFLLSQSPKSMRETVVGLWLSLRVLRGYLDFIVIYHSNV